MLHLISSLSFFACQGLKLTESEKLQVQIQAYLDNVLDVGALLEDAENRGGMLEHVDELQEHNAQVCLQKLHEKQNNGSFPESKEAVRTLTSSDVACR